MADLLIFVEEWARQGMIEELFRAWARDLRLQEAMVRGRLDRLATCH
jgi:hypothetical protein